MLKTSLNGLLIVFLMLSYLNRGLFVNNMSEGNLSYSNHTSQTGNEINSVLELILNLTGNVNDIDEDGDLPESYCFSFVQPFIFQNLTQTLEQNDLFSKDITKKFYVTSDAIFSLSVYGQIDHPPEA